MKPVFLFLLLVVLLSCEEYKEFKANDPFYKSSYLHGRLMLTDEISGETLKPLSGKTIRIFDEKSKEDGNFIFSSVTTDEGYFRFDNLSESKSYKLIYSETINGKIYLADSVIKLPNDSLLFEAKISGKQPGVIFEVTDAQSQPLNNVNICIFSSQLPYLAEVCEMSNYTLKSGPRGKAGQFNMADGKYYVLAKTLINNVSYMDTCEIEISQNQLVRKTLTMKAEVSRAPQNTFTITTKDEEGNPVPHVRVCLFNSRVVFQSDTCNYSNYSALTNLKGEVTFNDLLPNTYYILAELYLNNRRLFARDSIRIENREKPFTKKMMLQ